LELFHRIRERCPAPFAGLVITENHDALLRPRPNPSDQRHPAPTPRSRA
jgi:para-aminobenzoate synthetase component 1